MSIVSTGKNILSHNSSALIEGRFATEAGKTARKLNRIAIERTKGDKMRYTFPDATPEDFTRLTSPKIEDSYKRVTWTNPDTNKTYHILEEGRDNGMVQVRILDKNGKFIRNAELKPKNIVIYDIFYSLRGLSHGEVMEVLLKRFNPFANVERLNQFKGFFEYLSKRKLSIELEIKRFRELADQMDKGKKVDYISSSLISPVSFKSTPPKRGIDQRNAIFESGFIDKREPLFQRILSHGTRIFEAAGNDTAKPKLTITDELAIDGVEGVGSLINGKVAPDSCSRNSIFTQHYERRDYYPRLSKDRKGNILGINISGLNGTDLPLNWKTKRYAMRGVVGGTSCATPVRVAKESLYQMMKDVELP